MFSKITYEVQLEREGRWIVESSADDEAHALEIAHRILKQRAEATAARVMKQTVSITGNRRESEIFRKSQELSEVAVTLTGNPDSAPVCQDAAACYALPSRMAMVRLLKLFLDKFQIAPVEMLHSHSYLRKFDDATRLIGAAFHQVGGAQAKQLGVPAAGRIASLMEYYKAIHERARQFSEMRKSLPELLAGEIETTYFALGRNDAANAQFDFNALVAFEFQTGMYVAREQKLGTIVGWFAATDEKDLRDWLDEWIADYLCFPEIIDGLLGQQFNFFEFLLRLIEVADGKKQFTKTADSPLLVPIRAALAAAALPQTQAVLVDRLVREIRTEKPLDRRDVEREELLIKDLEKALKLETGGMLGGAAVEDAMATRKLRERKRKLRGMGLDDVADGLG